jgi:hypothetical protein
VILAGHVTGDLGGGLPAYRIAPDCRAANQQVSYLPQRIEAAERSAALLTLK